MNNLCAPVLSTLAAVALVAPAHAAADWMTDLPAALQKARQEGKLVLVDFTGSDWCSACIKLRCSVLDTPEFRAFAAEYFVLMEVDLPQRRDFDAGLRVRNEEIAARYHVAGYPTVMVLNPQGEVVGGFEGALSQEQVKKQLHIAMTIDAVFKSAAEKSGVERAKTLMFAYRCFPSSKSFSVAYEQLRTEIMKADPDNVTGIQEETAAVQQAELFLQQRNALRINDPAMGQLLERQLKEAYPQNRPAIMKERCQHALAMAESIEDILKAKKMFGELSLQLPEAEAAEVRHFIDTYFKSPEELLQMLKRSRY